MNKKQQSDLAKRASDALARVRDTEKALASNPTFEGLTSYNDALQARDAVLAEMRKDSEQPQRHDASDVVID